MKSICKSCKGENNSRSFCMLWNHIRMAIQKPIGEVVVSCSEYREVKYGKNKVS